MTRIYLMMLLPELPRMQRRLVEYLMKHGPARGSTLYTECGCLSYNQQLNKARRFKGVPVVSEPIKDSSEWQYSLALEA